MTGHPSIRGAVMPNHALHRTLSQQRFACGLSAGEGGR
jgi:hypothetical protein